MAASTWHAKMAENGPVTQPGCQDAPHCLRQIGLTLANAADLIRAVAGVLWVGFALAAIVVLLKVLGMRGGSLTRLGLGPSGVTMEFAEAKLDEAVRRSRASDQGAVGHAAKRTVLDRLQRNADLLSRARILWADDHPEYNAAIADLLRRFGATVDTPRTNAEALNLMVASRYNVVISDVARDDEGPGSDLKGLQLAEVVHRRWGIRTLLFTARFNPATMPSRSEAERLELVRSVQQNVFGVTNRTDEALHLILDVLERS